MLPVNLDWTGRTYFLDVRNRDIGQLAGTAEVKYELCARLPVR